MFLPNSAKLGQSQYIHRSSILLGLKIILLIFLWLNRRDCTRSTALGQDGWMRFDVGKQHGNQILLQDISPSGTRLENTSRLFAPFAFRLSPYFRIKNNTTCYCSWPQKIGFEFGPGLPRRR